MLHSTTRAICFFVCIPFSTRCKFHVLHVWLYNQEGWCHAWWDILFTPWTQSSCSRYNLQDLSKYLPSLEASMGSIMRSWFWWRCHLDSSHNATNDNVHLPSKGMQERARMIWRWWRDVSSYYQEIQWQTPNSFVPHCFTIHWTIIQAKLFFSRDVVFASEASWNFQWELRCILRERLVSRW